MSVIPGEDDGGDTSGVSFAQDRIKAHAKNKGKDLIVLSFILFSQVVWYTTLIWVYGKKNVSFIISHQYRIKGKVSAGVNPCDTLLK